MTSFEVQSDGPERTRLIASALAPHLRRGDVVLLTGDLAVGKTTAIKAVAAALGSADTVTSPTFTLANIYAASTGPVLHIDAYRLSGVHEFRDLGLDEYIEESITLIEWGEVVAEDFPCHLTVSLRLPPGLGADFRVITFEAECDEWLSRMPSIRDDLAEAAMQPAGSVAS
jgi:tRNA threonylcarbamoyladenosine biosynthesis protein TsaE